MMDIDILREGDAVVAEVRGRLDTISAQAFEKGIADALEGDETVVVFDLSGLEYISSAGLRVILGTAKALKARGGEIRLAAMTGPVNKVFEISGFLKMFKHFETRSSALAKT